MISNQVLQSTIDSIKGIARLDIAIADIDGKVLATTFVEDRDLSGMVVSFAESQADSQAAGGFQFFKIFDEHQLEFVLIAHGDTDDVYMVGKLAVLQVQTLLVAYREKFDKDNFVKNLLLDNLLLVDIYNRAKKLHIEVGVRRVVFLVESDETIDVQAQDALKEFFSSESNDFVTAGRRLRRGAEDCGKHAGYAFLRSNAFHKSRIRYHCERNQGSVPFL